MNEVLNVLCIDVLFNLTADSRTPAQMEILGFMFIFCIFSNLMIHMFFIVRGGCRDVSRKCKNKSYLKRYKVWYAALSEDEKEKYDDPDEV